MSLSEKKSFDDSEEDVSQLDIMPSFEKIYFVHFGEVSILYFFV